MDRVARDPVRLHGPYHEDAIRIIQGDRSGFRLMLTVNNLEEKMVTFRTAADLYRYLLHGLKDKTTATA